MFIIKFTLKFFFSFRTYSAVRRAILGNEIMIKYSHNKSLVFVGLPERICFLPAILVNLLLKMVAVNRLPDEVGSDGFFLFREGDSGGLGGGLGFQEPGEVAGERSQDLPALGVLELFLGTRAVGRVPVLRRGHRHLVDREIFVQTVKGR